MSAGGLWFLFRNDRVRIVFRTSRFDCRTSVRFLPLLPSPLRSPIGCDAGLLFAVANVRHAPKRPLHNGCLRDYRLSPISAIGRTHKFAEEAALLLPVRFGVDGANLTLRQWGLAVGVRLQKEDPFLEVGSEFREIEDLGQTGARHSSGTRARSKWMAEASDEIVAEVGPMRGFTEAKLARSAVAWAMRRVRRIGRVRGELSGVVFDA